MHSKYSKQQNFKYKFYEERMKAKEEKEKELRQKMKSRVSKIILTNEHQKEIDREERDSDLSDQESASVPIVPPKVIEIDQPEPPQKVDLEEPDQEQLYEVEKILDKKLINSEIHYLVKWKQLSHSQCTWEPILNLMSAIHLVDEFNARFHSFVNKSPLKLNKSGKNPRKTKQGRFECGDTASKIVNVKKNDKNELVFTIEWAPRPNKSIPMQTEYTNKQLRVFDPHLLINFYESNMQISAQAKDAS